eukprot:754810-Hanusia_phi.AAC.1
MMERGEDRDRDREARTRGRGSQARMYKGARVLALAALSLFAGWNLLQKLHGTSHRLAVVLIERHGSTTLVERIPDTGEDYFSAIEPPHRPYECHRRPWLKDKKFSDRVRPLGYEPSDAWNGEPQWYSGYLRTQYDEFGDRAYDVDMRPVALLSRVRLVSKPTDSRRKIATMKIMMTATEKGLMSKQVSERRLLEDTAMLTTLTGYLRAEDSGVQEE